MEIKMRLILVYAGVWLKNIALAADQFLNAIFWGDPDETLSRRAARACESGTDWGCTLCKWLDKVDERHCQKTLDRVQRPEGYMSVPQQLSRWKKKHAAA